MSGAVTSARHRVVVVGGGVLGSAVAASIAAKGMRVTLVTDDPRPTTQASAASFAWVNANAEPDAYAAFKSAARAEHARAGAGDWFFQTGSDSDGVRTEADGYVDVTRFLAVHRERLLAAGGILHAGVRVRRLRRRAGSIVLECEDTDAVAEELTADTVVVAAGVGTVSLAGALADSSGVVTRRIGTATGPRGFLARMRVDHDLPGIRSTNGLQLRPDGPGILAAQSLTIERALREQGQRATAQTVWDALRLEIAASLGRDVPSDALISIDEAARPMSADGKPVAGWIANGVYALLTHSGVTLAPLLAELVARDLAGDDDERLGPYRPESLIG